MIDYMQGKIYKIYCNTTGKTYYGSTCQPTLAKRLADHVQSFKKHSREPNKYAYTTSFEVIKGGDYSIALVESVPCKTKDELHSKERYYIENNECVNKVIPTRNVKDYRETNLESYKKYMEEWRENNKNHIKQTRKAYDVKNRGKIAQYKREHYKQIKENDAVKYEHIKTLDRIRGKRYIMFRDEAKRLRNILLE